ncbi:MAG TPA: phenylalanine--tRNA ligase subunit beta [Candidatus Saccharimonadales bacterium]|nr:phenylalanine--tRNA ligase subunit beta [Candidatus Saccharimonadales bacterium]
MKIAVNTIRGMNARYGCAADIMPDGIEKLVEKIGAQLGAVEEVKDLSKKYQGIIIVKVVSCVKHPNADKLHICKIDDNGVVKAVKRDKDGSVQVVCGAPNVRAGMYAAWLPPGATVPSSVDKEPFVLEAREIRGEKSNGMLASPSELAISDDHSGILEITEKVKAGADFAREFGLDDYVIDIENKMLTHRPDCFGFLGISRELAGIQQMPFKSPQWYKQKPAFPKTETTQLPFKVRNGLPKLVPRFTVITMSDVQVGPSPLWLQIELAKVGQRSINNIVDYTNFFMLETGQPLHAYDYDKLPAPSLETRLSKKGDKLKLLNGKQLILEDDTTILITSGDKPVGIGGVMGGAETEVDAHTKNIVLECANFNMYSIRRTSMRYGLFTDAVTRFNKGQSPLQNLAVLAKIVDEIRQFAGGKVAGNVADIGHTETAQKAVRANVGFINDRLGLDLSADEMHKLLKNVEFDIERTDNKAELKVTPPFWRTDIEIPEDIVEEIGRLYGYDHLPLVLPRRDLTPAPQDKGLKLKQHLRKILSEAGANEVLTYSFVHGDLIDKVGQDRKLAYTLSNALSPDLQYYRMSLTPSLLDRVHPNIKAGYDEFAIFELGKGHNKSQMDEHDKALPKEFQMLSLVSTVSDKKANEHTGAAYYSVRRYLDYLGRELGVALRYVPIEKEEAYQVARPFDYKRSAAVWSGDVPLGMVGEYRTSVLKQLKLPRLTAGFEIGIEQLMASIPKHKVYDTLSRFPKVEQDISLKVPAAITYQAVHEALAVHLLAIPGLRAELQPLDIYQDTKDLKHKHIAFRFTVSSYEKTLKNQEVNDMLDKAAAAAHAKLGAERL